MKTIAILLSFCIFVQVLGGESESKSEPETGQAVKVEASFKTEKQIVFLFCPHTTELDSISFYVVVDKDDPKNILSMGLEEMPGKNSKSDSYKGVLKSQSDPATEKRTLSTMEAKDFDIGTLKVEKKDALTIRVSKLGLTPSYSVRIDARVGQDAHFIVGGEEQSKRDIVLKFDKTEKKWNIQAKTLQDSHGRDVANEFQNLTGICFSAGSTCVYRICAVDVNGRAAIIMDRN